MSGEELNLAQDVGEPLTVSNEEVHDKESDVDDEDNDKDADPGAAVLGEETASSSQFDGEDDEVDEIDDDDDDDDNSSWPPEDVMASMPLLKYVRLSGSLPRNVSSGTKQNSLSIPSTCAAIGRVILIPDASSIGGNNNPLATTAVDGSKLGDDSLLHQRRMMTDATPHYIMMIGFENGKLLLVDVPTGSAIIASDQLHVREGRPQQSPAVVDVSFDASATVAGAIDQDGMSAIWELKYTTTTPTRSSGVTSASTSDTSSLSPSTAMVAPENVFASLMSAWSMPAAPKPSTQQPAEDSSALLPRVVASLVQVARLSYPRSFGRPTCLALDPGYKRKRDKCLLVGFADGRLVLTKRGFFQRRNDSVIYQGTKRTDGQYHGIEALTWRGPLVAWADASGIKLFDVDSQVRIAQVDRPAGARPSLYPTVNSLRPCLYFETKDILLVAWGDCLMNLAIRETTVLRSRTESGSTDGSVGPGTPNNPPTVVRRRQVECTMAWELDCVACGVSPLDAEHILVFGLVPPFAESDSATENVKADEITEGNDLEIQVVSRINGTVTYCDALPMLRREGKSDLKAAASASGSVADSASSYHLLSSFALPRAEDMFEADIDELQAADEDMDMDMSSSIFGVSSETKIKFLDSHLKWSLKDVSFGEGDQTPENNVITPKFDNSHRSRNAPDFDSQSVDSDDYDFVVRPSADLESEVPLRKTTPPLLIFTSSSDVVVARTRDVDDAVQHALAINKKGLALRRGLFRRQQLKRYKINDLVNEYLRELLRINTLQDENGSHDGPNDTSSRLSIRRLKLAAESTPILLGGNISMWKSWISEFAKIPGGLFVLRDFVPVRDPKLPRHIYGKVLHGQLAELEKMLSSTAGESIPTELSPRVVRQTQDHFLDTLIAWGCTEVMKELIKYHKHFETISPENTSMNSIVRSVVSKTEDAIQRRYTQTAAGYLRFSTSQPTLKTPQKSRSVTAFTDDPMDALFDVDELFDTMSSRAPMIFDQELNDMENETVPSELINSQAALEALGRLSMMQGKYDNALKCFLAMGSLFSTVSLSTLEDEAIAEVNSADSDGNKHSSRREVSIPSSAFVLAMIEGKQLHQCLLDRYFVTKMEEDNKFHPLLCLFQLVGLELMGRFLLEHCVAPSVATNLKSSQSDASELVAERHESLPIDLVADQLTSNPKLLHWYLHLVLTCKPEVYTKFPNTAYPPKAITELHRTHLDLFIEYAGQDRDSVKALSGMETYKMDRKNTPLLSFLKDALPLGGIRIADVKRLLEEEREKDKATERGDFSRVFALELAFVIEQYGENTEEEALLVLDLYVKGTDSLTLAVSYAQRTRDYSSILWERLTEHCISSDKRDTKDGEAFYTGKKFGLLLEAAALSGADLAKLVTHIPDGMAVQGLRTRLVAAVADYRMKLKLHKATVEIAAKEKIMLLRELAHRSRRGMRYQVRNQSVGSLPLWQPPKSDSLLQVVTTSETNNTLPKGLRTRERRDRYTLSFSLPTR